MKILLVAGLCTILTTGTGAQELPALKFPIKLELQQSKFAWTDGTFECPPTIVLPHKVVRILYYTDPPQYSKVDQLKLAEFQREEAPIRSAEKILSDSVTLLARSNHTAKNKKIVSCIVEHLLKFAQDEAFTGSDDIGGSGLVQLFSVTPLFAYGTIKDNLISNSERQIIESWIRRLAEKIIEWQSKFPRFNNIAYWGGAALALAAVDLNERRFLDAALQIAAGASREIDRNDLLPRELERGDRSLEYSLFATNALAVIELVASRNEASKSDVLSNDILRLMTRMVKSIRNPDSFSEISKKPASIAKERIYGQNLGWLEMYREITGDVSVDELICRYRPLGSYGTGGDWFFLLGDPSQCAP